MATSGFYGAAAITAALATIGGPFGMLGGIAVLIPMGMTAKALAEYGFPKLADAVVDGLIASGESTQTIAKSVSSIPRWALPSEARSKVLSSLESEDLKRSRVS
jgi:hypothetical protein